MKLLAIIYISLYLIIACSQTTVYNATDITPDPKGHDIASRFPVPVGFSRTKADSSCFGFYLRHLPLKEEGAKVYHYDGTEKRNSDVAAAVVNIDIGDKDLQQCADAVIRLRAEYLYSTKQYNAIHFRFTSGFNAEYSKWRNGYRIKVKGNNVSWYKAGDPDNSYATFRKYLDQVFQYAGTLSLSRELKTIPVQNLAIGDVFIMGGSPGHAVIVVDVAEKGSQKIFMIAQSYMPAQNIHVLKNPENKALSPWFIASEGIKLYTPEWTFSWTDLKRFE
ncbi:MAG: DUF4846 domain-containing protein [Bacteroidetes bacterium]|nr:DUF4846 domain-containing protein [Bacteroidota bacterium]